MRHRHISEVFMILPLLGCYSLAEKCTREETSEEMTIACKAMDAETIFSQNYNTTTNRVHNINLQIDKSNWQILTVLPLKSEGYQEISLQIKNSGLEQVHPNSLKELQQLQTLDLSNNKIVDTIFLKSTNVKTRLDLSHNRINMLDLHHFERLDMYPDSSIDLSYNNITNFTLCKGHISVEYLNLSHNLLSDLGVLLARFKQVQYVDLSHNKLTKLNRNNFPEIYSLAFFDVSNNAIISIDPQINIYSLNVANNQLTFCNLTGSDYRVINLTNNKLDSLSNILPKNGMSSYRNRNYPYSRNNHITLTSLTLRQNIITQLRLTPQISQRYEVSDLDLSYNKIDYIELDYFRQMEISYKLNLSYNNIAHLNNSNFGNSKMISLDLAYNPLEFIEKSAFSGLSSLRFLNISHCLLSKLETKMFSMLHTLSRLDLSFNKMDHLTSKTFNELNLQYLDVSFNRLKDLHENSFYGSSIANVNLGFNEKLNLGRHVFNHSKIQNLNLTNTGIKLINSESFANLRMLTSLYLDQNLIESLPKQFLGYQSHLQYLSVTRNPISNINGEGFHHLLSLNYLNLTIMGELPPKRFNYLGNLIELTISDSKIPVIRKDSFRGLFSLKKINFKNTTCSKIEAGAFSGLFLIEELDCGELFSDIHVLESGIFSGLERLKSLDLSNLNITKIESFAFQGLEMLKQIDLSNIGIKNIEGFAFSGLSNLQTLNISYNNISSIHSSSFQNLEELIMLDLSHSKITGDILSAEIFANLYSLTELHLQNNELEHFAVGILFNLETLFYLDLSGNRLKHLELSSPSLVVLNVSFNLLNNEDGFDIKSLQSLERIDINGNLWLCEDLSFILKRFRESGVQYKGISKSHQGRNVHGVSCLKKL